MADLRLLRRWGGLALLAALPGCTNPIPRPIGLPRIAGTVVDKRTQEPVQGAEVFVAYDLSYHPIGAFHSQWVSYARRWVTTDAEGRFDFDPVCFWAVGSKDIEPPLNVHVLHRDFGYLSAEVPRERDRWAEELLVEIEPDEYTLRLIHDPRLGSGRVCDGMAPDEFVRCCEVAYGSVEACRHTRRGE